MDRAPAVIIIARHGARLDAQDKDWQQNSDEPYNTPLTYGGWTQLSALGVRIASLLRERDVTLNNDDDDDDDADATNHDSESIDQKKAPNGQGGVHTKKPKRRKHKVVIHSSPFIRCVQSSIAICAGMAHYQGNLARFEETPLPGALRRPLRRPMGPRSKSIDPLDFAQGRSFASPTSQPRGLSKTHDTHVESQYVKPVLRIDACLGEWLCPDYFEGVKPPPSSEEMVASAKATLARPATPLQGFQETNAKMPEPPVLSLDGEPLEKDSSPIANDIPSDTVPESVPESHENGTGTASIEEILIEDLKPKGCGQQTRHLLSESYSAPKPTFALASGAAIPGGYVAHARDSCVEVDAEWDSMSPPQSWGDGGEYGEEWSSMHRRFRKGLMDIITWYKQRGPFVDPQADARDCRQYETLDADEDIVLVLVTHGAGCNALIGALTNQPALIDVGMGSLTMAVRKDPSQLGDRLARLPSGSRRRASVDTSQAAEYDVKVVASTDHLRATADPGKFKSARLQALRSPGLQPLQIPSPLGSIHEGLASGASTPRNSALGSMRRSRAATANSNRSASREVYLSPSPSGLWSGRPSPVSSIIESPDGSNGDITPDLPSSGGRGLNSALPTPTEVATPKSSASSTGLWGGPAPRAAPSRRWTFTERN